VVKTCWRPAAGKAPAAATAASFCRSAVSRLPTTLATTEAAAERSLLELALRQFLVR
jgi:hypothetical protein